MGGWMMDDGPLQVGLQSLRGARFVGQHTEARELPGKTFVPAKIYANEIGAWHKCW